jgi:hypothetical protein
MKHVLLVLFSKQLTKKETDEQFKTEEERISLYYCEGNGAATTVANYVGLLPLPIPVKDGLKFVFFFLLSQCRRQLVSCSAFRSHLYTSDLGNPELHLPAIH